MNSQVAIRRSRGAVTGVILVLLGLWGGLAPFVGHYLHFGFTPDTAFGYTTGRLYYSVLPAAAVLIGGVLIIATRLRTLGIIGGVLASLGGLWFVVGSGAVLYLFKRNVSIGAPLGSAGGTYTTKEYLEVLALYTALGAVVIFFGALACGRMSLISASDAVAAEEYGFDGQEIPVSSTYSEPQTTGSFPTIAGQFPPRSAPFGDAPRPLSPDDTAQ
jgi:hypothetical protein